MICVGIARGRHRHMIAEHKFLADNGIGLVELRLDFIQGTRSWKVTAPLRKMKGRGAS